jgi:flagellar protein FliO/FliZ
VNQFATSIFGPTFGPIISAIATLAFVVGLLWLAWILVKRYRSGLFVSGGRGRAPRLAVIDALPVDGHRRLVLVRRDDIEHLVLIGGPADLVVETGIRSAAAAVHAAQHAAAAVAPKPAAQAAREAVTDVERGRPVRVDVGMRSEQPARPDVQIARRPTEPAFKLPAQPEAKAAPIQPAAAAMASAPIAAVPPVAATPTAPPPVAPAPLAEATVTVAPVAEAPVVEAPVVEAPVVEAPVVEAPVVEAPAAPAPAHAAIAGVQSSSSTVLPVPPTPPAPPAPPVRQELAWTVPAPAAPASAMAGSAAAGATARQPDDSVATGDSNISSQLDALLKDFKP